MARQRRSAALRGRVFLAIAVVAADDSEACAASGIDCSKEAQWGASAEIYEYTSTANPKMTEVPIRAFGPELHQHGPSRVIPLDLSAELELDYAATAPNLLASFIRILAGERFPTGVERATSQSFYVIRGSGRSYTRAGEVTWKEGDLFVLPYLGDEVTPVCDEKSQCLQHACLEESHYGGCALYWVHDEPLLKYLGVRPDSKRRFEPTLYPGSVMRDTVAAIPNEDELGQVRNRRGILLGNVATPQTKTLTPTMWSLLNSIGANASQDPHKHSSVALDLAVSGGQAGKVYSLLGRELDANGSIVDPVRVEWTSGGVFVTPPGWWHSHHNDGTVAAWVLPIQDAGLYTYQRTLDIRFMSAEKEQLKRGASRGATLPEEMAKPVPPMVAGTIMTGHGL